ncbi:MAG: C_GCAxxG_C_C family protein [Bacteroidales bacterium]|nr:C_GCAxxG_C_C family protein [Bacteroidales bacterium]
MGKKLKRRVFIGRITAFAAGSITLGACFRSKDSPGSSGENRIAENREMPRDLVYKLLDQKVNHYMQISFNCAQSSYLALEEQFGLEGNEVLRALTPLAGIAERGETCGAVIGPLMIFGLIYGRGKDRLNDWNTYRDSLVPAGAFCRLFEQEYGSTMCRDIQKRIFGKSFDLTDPDDLREFRESDATNRCSSVVRKAVRIAAEIILDNTNDD